MGGRGRCSVCLTSCRTRRRVTTMDTSWLRWPCTRRASTSCESTATLSTTRASDRTKAYWEPGNGETFLNLVAGLTGSPLSSDAWIAELQEDLEARIAREREEYPPPRPRVPPS